ncbi:MAG TPA: 2Fe-2S iron-sulfur cluster binding domain-containing protein [Steroidobacteraceae bacterium]
MFDFLKRRPPAPATVTVEPFGWTFAVEPGQTILQAALAQGLPWPSRCRVGSCTTCRCRLLEGAVKQLTDTSYVLSQEQLANGTVLACQSQPQGPVRVHLEKARARLPADAASEVATG